MLKYFFAYYDEAPAEVQFSMFDASHFIWLGALALLTVIACVIYRRLGQKGRKGLLLTSSFLLLVLEIVNDIYLAIRGYMSVYYLPFHLCSLSQFVCLWYSFSRSRLAAELLYCICMPGAVAAQLCPSWTGLPPLSFLSINSYLFHAVLILVPLMLIFGGEFKPNPGLLPRCLLVLAATVPPIYLFNKVFDTNFMFLNWPSPGSPLVIFESLWGNPGYLFGFPILLAAVWLVLYIPCLFGFVERKKGNKEASAS